VAAVRTPPRRLEPPCRDAQVARTRRRIRDDFACVARLLVAAGPVCACARVPVWRVLILCDVAQLGPGPAAEIYAALGFSSALRALKARLTPWQASDLSRPPVVSNTLGKLIIPG
jgi:hypothetical protein